MLGVNMLDKWANEFGDEYSKRNIIDVSKRAYIFNELLKDLRIGYFLEVGANKGHNIEALGVIGIPGVGIEPNRKCVEIADVMLIKGDAYDIPLKSNFCDLVFTAGVLIHIPTEMLDRAIEEMKRVSKKYVMAIEYYSDDETEVDYREGVGLWRRPYGKILERHGLKIRKTGDMADLGIDEGTDFSKRSKYWICEKST